MQVSTLLTPAAQQSGHIPEGLMRTCEVEPQLLHGIAGWQSWTRDLLFTTAKASETRIALRIVLTDQG
jgi:hypothetical protein